jgi:hypothetical protein
MLYFRHLLLKNYSIGPIWVYLKKTNYILAGFEVSGPEGEDVTGLRKLERGHDQTICWTDRSKKLVPHFRMVRNLYITSPLHKSASWVQTQEYICQPPPLPQIWK